LSKFFNSGTSLITEFDFMQKRYLNQDSPISDFSGLETEGDGQSRQIVGLVRLAQAVGTTTGISAQVLIRRNLSSSVRYLIDYDGYYYSDEELFDDVFGYEAEQFNITLKQKLPWNVQASIGATYLLKHYSNRLALDVDGYAFDDLRLRDDQRLIGSFSLSKAWKYSSAMPPISLTLDVSMMNNRSNDPYYMYKTSYFSFGLQQNF
jgi:hypothetical protein